jgi:diacylglycerol kinase (ATP)
VNEVASSLAGTEYRTLGVIPFGSGNGLARFLQIPYGGRGGHKKYQQRPGTATIDAGTLNGKYFFNMAGMGFDAHISEVFSSR